MTVSVHNSSLVELIGIRKSFGKWQICLCFISEVFSPWATDWNWASEHLLLGPEEATQYRFVMIQYAAIQNHVDMFQCCS